MKRSWKIFLIIAAIGLISPFVWISYFVVANDAPIIIGEVIRNIEYKEGQELDIYTPTQQAFSLSPVILYIHGGAWIGGSKETINLNRYNRAVKQLRESGYSVVSINYTLAEDGKSPFPNCIEDANDAFKWIINHADTFHFDTNNIGLFGESAGAQIAMMMAFTSDSLKNNPYTYLIDVYGPNRLKEAYASALMDSIKSYTSVLPESWQAKFDVASYLLGFHPTSDSLRAFAMMDKYSPYNYVHKNIPKTLIIQGDSDQLVPLDQSLVLSEKMKSMNIDHEIHILKKVNHGFIGATDEQMDSLQNWVSEFIQANYRNQHLTSSKQHVTE